MPHHKPNKCIGTGWRMFYFCVHARETRWVCFLSVPANMHVFARPELAEQQTARRSVRLTVVGAVWLGELLPHGFSKRSWSNPRLAHKPSHPLRLPHTHTREYTCKRQMDRWSESQDRQTDFLLGDRQENDTHLKRRRVTDRLTD